MKAGWEVKALGEVASITKRQGGSRPLPYVGLEHVSSGGTGQFLGSMEPQTDKSMTFEFEPKHLLYGRLRPYLNKVLLPDFVGHCSSEIFPIFPSAQLDRRYRFYWITNQTTVDAINETCTGARMPRANVADIFTFPIPLPPLDEQKRIVAVLDAAFDGLSRARAHTETNLQNARELFDEVASKVFNNDLAGWEVRTVSECFRLKSGDGLVTSAMIAGPYSVYGGNGVAGTHNEFNLTGESTIVGRVGALCGNARRITEKIWLTDNAFKLVDLKFDFDLSFLTYLLNFKDLRQFARQTAQPVISNSSLKNLELAFPPSKERQAELALVLEETEAESAKLQFHYRAKLADLDALRQALLQKAFAGELT